MTREEREQEDLDQLEWIRKWREEQELKKLNKKSWKERIREIFRRRKS
jgi:hypothetical protein